MQTIEVLETGLIYRNPKPHLQAVHAWHPSVDYFDDGQMVCSFDLGQAVSSDDYRSYFSRSTDNGRTWSQPVRILEDWVEGLTSHCIRISRMSDNSLVGLGSLNYRKPGLGNSNPKTFGRLPNDMFITRSKDRGQTWSPAEIIDMPLVGPAWELCHCIVELQDGRWLAPMANWKGWDGEAPNDFKAFALVSTDKGKTWPTYIDIINQWDRRIISFENSVVQMHDGRLLAVTWALNDETGKSEPTPYVISTDGKKFSAPRLNGMRGQTTKLIALEDGRILCVYRRDDQPGLWANLAQIDGDDWINIEQTPVWQGAASGMSGQGSNEQELGDLKLGFPNLTLLPDNLVYVAFWCFEDGIHNIRWYRLRING